MCGSLPILENVLPSEYILITFKKRAIVLFYIDCKLVNLKTFTEFHERKIDKLCLSARISKYIILDMPIFYYFGHRNTVI